jgi:hypothetical protein
MCDSGSKHIFPCERCGEEVDNVWVCRVCTYLYCQRCASLPALKNMCQDGSKHIYQKPATAVTIGPLVSVPPNPKEMSVASEPIEISESVHDASENTQDSSSISSKSFDIKSSSMTATSSAQQEVTSSCLSLENGGECTPKPSEKKLSVLLSSQNQSQGSFSDRTLQQSKHEELRISGQSYMPTKDEPDKGLTPQTPLHLEPVQETASEKEKILFIHGECPEEFVSIGREKEMNDIGLIVSSISSLLFFLLMLSDFL